MIYNHNSPFYNVKFSDCGASSIRNFFKIILYDHETNTFDTTRLKYLEANPDLIEYFDIFDKDVYFTNLSSIESCNKETKYFELSDTIETAWNKIVQNLKGDVRYHRKIEIKNQDIWYEIASGLNKTKTLPNLLCVFKALFLKNEKCAITKSFIEIFEVILNKYNRDNRMGLFNINDQSERNGLEQYLFQTQDMNFGII